MREGGVVKEGAAKDKGAARYEQSGWLREAA